ncbi:unnamed protein product [Caenorhabditis auriculariae]|uniref:Cyclin C-terminal domain-containing protein n=1 Tax=Caenorhabditis auriculariae TaxID=2777116 RepID=A0A8S1GY98_9PELO|nr:unnamed protein product [Caenorhabditis auriculariae]
MAKKGLVAALESTKKAADRKVASVAKNKALADNKNGQRNARKFVQSPPCDDSFGFLDTPPTEKKLDEKDPYDLDDSLLDNSIETDDSRQLVMRKDSSEVEEMEEEDEEVDDQSDFLSFLDKTNPVTAVKRKSEQKDLESSFLTTKKVRSQELEQSFADLPKEIFPTRKDTSDGNRNEPLSPIIDSTASDEEEGVEAENNQDDTKPTSFSDNSLNSSGNSEGNRTNETEEIRKIPVPPPPIKEEVDTLSWNEQIPTDTIMESFSNDVCVEYPFILPSREFESLRAKIEAKFEVKQEVDASPSTCFLSDPAAVLQRPSALPGPLVSDICWSFCSQRESDNLCQKELAFDIFHTLRKGDDQGRIKVPLLLARKVDEVEEIASELNVDKSFVMKSCSEADRRAAVLQLLGRRERFSLSLETLHLGVALLDKSFNVFVVDRVALNDLALISMVIASKLMEYNALKLSDLISTRLVENKTVKELGFLEKRILKELDYRLEVPTSFTFSNFLMLALKVTEEQICLTHYLLELALLSLDFRYFPSAQVSHAAVCLASAILPKKEFPSAVLALCYAERRLKDFSRIDGESTRNIMRSLVVQYDLAIKERHESFREYTKSERKNVANAEIPKELRKLILDTK